MNFKDELFLVIETLDQAAIPYALCGGVAVIIHGYPRATRDIDILIREDDLEAAREALKGAGYTLPSGMLRFGAGRPEERRLFRVTKAEGGDHFTVDLLLATTALEPVWRDRESHEVEGVTLSVVSRDGLALMKRTAGRPQDLADLSQLGLEGEG